MDETTRQALTAIRAAINVLGDYDLHSGQDADMVCEMADKMLADLLDGQDQTMNHYIGRYCTVADGPADVDEIVLEIDRQITDWETPS